MKSKPSLILILVLLGAGLWLGGCSSIDAEAPRGAGLKNIQRFFVVSNLNDNHAINQRIATALQARGFTAESGPLTMMPDNTQAVITYQDHWSWDFGEHIDYLRLIVRGPDSNEIITSATFSARIPGKDVPATVTGLVASLFDTKGTPARPADKLPVSPEEPAGGRRRKG